MLIIPARGNWFQTNQPDHKSDDCALRTVCVTNEKDMAFQWQNLINIYHCIVVQYNRNYRRDWDFGSCESLVICDF